MVFVIHWHESTIGIYVSHHPELPSHLPLHPICQGCPSAPALGALFQTWNVDWWSISHMVIHMFPILNTPPSSLPVPSLWVVPVHQPQASSIMHRTWTGDSFRIWYASVTFYFSDELDSLCELNSADFWNSVSAVWSSRQCLSVLGPFQHHIPQSV